MDLIRKWLIAALTLFVLTHPQLVSGQADQSSESPNPPVYEPHPAWNQLVPFKMQYLLRPLGPALHWFSREALDGTYIYGYSTDEVLVFDLFLPNNFPRAAHDLEILLNDKFIEESWSDESVPTRLAEDFRRLKDLGWTYRGHRIVCEVLEFVVEGLGQKVNPPYSPADYSFRGAQSIFVYTPRTRQLVQDVELEPGVWGYQKQWEGLLVSQFDPEISEEPLFVNFDLPHSSEYLSGLGFLLTPPDIDHEEVSRTHKVLKESIRLKIEEVLGLRDESIREKAIEAWDIPLTYKQIFGLELSVSDPRTRGAARNVRLALLPVLSDPMGEKEGMPRNQWMGRLDISDDVFLIVNFKLMTGEVLFEYFHRYRPNQSQLIGSSRRTIQPVSAHLFFTSPESKPPVRLLVMGNVVLKGDAADLHSHFVRDSIRLQGGETVEVTCHRNLRRLHHALHYVRGRGNL